MSIPRKTIPISLEKSKPTILTPEVLKGQLTIVGLTCADSNIPKLSSYIADVKSQLPTGVLQAYSILKPCEGSLVDTLGLVSNLETSSTGNWKPGPMGYENELAYIQHETHFDWLKRNRKSFTGIESNPPEYRKKCDAVEAVKTLFVEVGANLSATLIKGLDKQDIESVLSNAIAPLSDLNASDYDVKDSRVIFLVDNYNEKTQEADGIGVLTVEWHLTIKDYKKKKTTPQHEARLTVKSRSVLYSSLEQLKADYLAAYTHFKDNSFSGLAANKIPKVRQVIIFDSLPPATDDTFSKSLLINSNKDFLDALVFYAPNLQNVGCIDNTNSSTTTTYSSSVTSGFTFSMSQAISAETYFEGSCEVVRAGLKVGFSISFTEQWSSSQTTEFSFSVPGGKKAFTYQGYLMCRVLRYNSSSGNYIYEREVGRFVTNILTTSETPLVESLQ